MTKDKDTDKSKYIHQTRRAYTIRNNTRQDRTGQDKYNDKDTDNDNEKDKDND